MLFQKSTLSASAAMLAVAPMIAHAHMLLANPVPYGKPNNSPLMADGSDFPCKAVPYTVNTANAWPVGSTQKLAFTGSAVHGGGSCQVSVSMDKAPTKNSVWKVIHSIEGGCPASADGNMASNDDSTFAFTIPKELPNGDMAMAWTWFNKIGNREMYMNCAPITVTGGSDDSTAFNALPDMAKANIGMGTCTTTESHDFTFQNPGNSKVKGGTGPFAPLCANAAAGGDGPAPSGPSQPTANPVPSYAPQQSSSPPQATANPGIPSAAPSGPQAGGPSTTTIRTMVTVTTAMAAPPAATQPYAAGPGKNPNAGPSKAPAGPSASGSPPSQGQPPSQAQPCPKDGAVVCKGDSRFGLCDNGYVVFMAVAEGTSCNNGVITKRHEHLHRHKRSDFSRRHRRAAV